MLKPTKLVANCYVTYGKTMSRVGNAPITIPEAAQVDIQKGGEYGNQHVKVSGPKGNIERSIRHGITVEQEDDKINVRRNNETKQLKSLHGLYRALIANMLEGVTNGFKKDLEIVGIGYRVEQQGDDIIFSLGYSHKIKLDVPEEITITLHDQNNLSVEGINKQQVGEVAAKIRSFRPPEPYKGKGVRYKDEQIRRKSVKQGS